MLHSLGPGQVMLEGARFVPPILSPLITAAQRGEPLEPVVAALTHMFGFDSFMYATSLSPRRGQECISYVFTTLSRESIRHRRAHGPLDDGDQLLRAWRDRAHDAVRQVRPASAHGAHVVRLAGRGIQGLAQLHRAALHRVGDRDGSAVRLGTTSRVCTTCAGSPKPGR